MARVRRHLCGKAVPRAGEALWLKRSASATADNIETIKQTALICVKNGIVSRFMRADDALRQFSINELYAYLDDLIQAYGLSEIMLVDTEGQEIARRGEYVVPDGGDPIWDGFELPNATTDERYSQWFKQISREPDPQGFSMIYTQIGVSRSPKKSYRSLRLCVMTRAAT